MSMVEKLQATIRHQMERIEELESQREKYKKALELIRSTNGLQYSDIFRICDEAFQSKSQEENL